MNTCNIGRSGEQKAVAWLESKDYKIIERNFRRRGFEVDIVAIDLNGVLRFIEVKTVVEGSVLDVAYSVEHRNIANYYKAVDSFILKHPEYNDQQMSMDVLMVCEKDFIMHESVTSEIIF